MKTYPVERYQFQFFQSVENLHFPQFSTDFANNINFSFIFLNLQNVMDISVDGGFGEWKNFGNCTAECRQKRIRNCDNPKPEGNGNDCEGETEDWVDCYQHPHCSRELLSLIFLTPVIGGYR